MLRKSDKRNTLRGQARQIVADYRRRHNYWVMRAQPTMPADQWKEYTKWVAAFGGTLQGKWRCRLVRDHRVRQLKKEYT